MVKRLFIFSIFLLLIDSLYAQSPAELRLKLKRSSPDTSRRTILQQLGKFYLYKANGVKSDLDSAIYFLNQAAQLSDKLHDTGGQYDTMELIGNYYAKAGNLELCKEYFMRIIAHYHQTGNIKEEAVAWDWLGRMYDNNGTNDHRIEKINCFQQARALYLQKHDRLNAADMLESIADTHKSNRQFDLAEHELQQALMEYKALGHKNFQETYTSLYTLEYTKGNYYRAMAYCSEAIRDMRTSRDTGQIGTFYFFMARCDYAAKKYAEALEWIHKALTSDKKYSYRYNCRLVEILLALDRTDEAREALSYLSKNKALAVYREDTVYVRRMFARYYAKINKNDLAIRSYEGILKLDFRKYLTEENGNNFYILCYNEISAIYLKTNQLAKAGKYLDEASLKVKNAKTPIQPYILSDLYYNIYKYDIATANYQTAVKNLEQHDRIKDSLFTSDKDKQVAELNIQYQTAQKEKSIQYLRNQGIVQQTSIEKINLQRNITIGGVVLFIIIAGLAYNGYRHKQQSNLQLQHKQTEINQQNHLLQELLKDKDKLLADKDWLLKEVHHRVKNNLQIVMSLLSSQSAYLENSAAIEAIRESQNRVHAISLIHLKLYKSNNVTSINMPAYVTDLLEYLADSFDTRKRHIRFEPLIEPINLDLAQAVPVGLILNESVTNSIKYAFVVTGGKISIALQLLRGETLLLTIADDGKGLPANFDLQNTTTLGMEMMKALSKQLGGEFKIGNNDGVRITIEFKIEKILPVVSEKTPNIS